MTFRDDILPDVDEIRRIPEELGLRGTGTITVKLRVEAWTADINVSGATASNTDVLMSPQPKVNLASEEVAAFYGVGPVDRVSGTPTASVYEIGPITPEHTAGGYSVLDLLGNDTPSAAKRCLVLLAGDGIGDTATTDVLFEIVRLDSSQRFRTMMTVRQTAQTPQ